MVYKKRFQFIYGPVSSWRLGCSLGIDLIALPKKTCTFDCIYCQLGRKPANTKDRKIFVPIGEIIKEIKKLPKVDIDYITFSGMGEPTLAKNLKNVIATIKRIRKEPIAILTNSSLMHKKAVREALLSADFVICKLDAYSQRSLDEINKPAAGIRFRDIIKGIKEFRKQYKGKLALQIMFIKNNKDALVKLTKLIRQIQPDEIQINTPLRPCNVEPLPKNAILKIKNYFASLKAIKVISVYDKHPKKSVAINIAHTFKRRGAV